MARRIMVQKEKTSREPNRATIQRGESLERNAPGFEAIRFCRSTVEGSLRAITRMPSNPEIRPVRKEWDTIPMDVEKLSFVPIARLNTPRNTAAKNTTKIAGP